MMFRPTVQRPTLRRPTLRRLAVAAAMAVMPKLAFAHPGHDGEAIGLAQGFLHPLGGLDHVLAMVMVGVFAAQLGGRASWALPAGFLGVMAIGGALGAGGIGLPLVEFGIAASVIGLGAAIALRLRPPVAAALAVVGVFALCHGHAHGAEMPGEAAGLGYAAGFLAATALLHATGLALAAAIGRVRQGATAMRLAGGAAAIAGLGLLAGLA